jgi:hypothetical protein
MLSRFLGVGCLLKNLVSLRGRHRDALQEIQAAKERWTVAGVAAGICGGVAVCTYLLLTVVNSLLSLANALSREDRLTVALWAAGNRK